MRMFEFLKTWEGTQAENKWSRIFITALLIIVLLMTWKLFRKETVVTIQPWTLSEEAWVTQADSSQSYKESWGWALSILLGNATPGSVGFIKERIKPLLAPSIYQDVIDTMEIQAQDIRDNRVTIRFEPRFVEYEKSTGKVFVSGHSFARGASFQAKEKRSEKTYEFTLKVSNYLPVLEFMDTYEGRPRTKKVLEQLERKAESKRRRDEKYN